MAPLANRQPADWRTELEAIARRLDRLMPDRRDPERFHVEKSELAGELRRMARQKGEKL
jgi:hypothetical protein